MQEAPVRWQLEHGGPACPLAKHMTTLLLESCQHAPPSTRFLDPSGDAHPRSRASMSACLLSATPAGPLQHLTTVCNCHFQHFAMQPALNTTVEPGMCFACNMFYFSGHCCASGGDSSWPAVITRLVFFFGSDIHIAGEVAAATRQVSCHFYTGTTTSTRTRGEKRTEEKKPAPMHQTVDFAILYLHRQAR